MITLLLINVALLWLVIIGHMILTLALVRRLNTQATTTTSSQFTTGLAVGTAAPSFTAQSLSGTPVTRADYKGKGVVLLFMRTGCGPCHDMLPLYHQVEADAARAGVALVLVSLDSLVQTRTFAEEFAVRLPILVAPSEENSLMSDYGITGTPAYCFIDATGHVAASGYATLEGGPWNALVETWTSASRDAQPRHYRKEVVAAH